MKFWDSSAVVPLLIEQSSSKSSLKLLSDDPLQLVSFTTFCECYSALARLEREEAFSYKDFSKAEDQLELLSGAWYVVNFSDAVQREVKRLLRTHTLKCADAFQIATALVGSEKKFKMIEFVSYDEQLLQAASKEGFEVIGCD